MAEHGDTEEYPDEQYPDLALFLQVAFPDSDFAGINDREAARRFVSMETPATMHAVLQQGQEFLALKDAPWDWVEDLANRNLGPADEARRWLARMLEALAAALRDQDRPRRG